MERTKDLDLIRDVAFEAGALALQWFHRGAEAWDKSPDNPVTQADIEVNERIAQRLLSARPDYGWLSEETHDEHENRDLCNVFVIDPIDGTKAFMRGEPYFCVSIALLHRDLPVAGVVYNPSTEEMFEATREGGARLNGQPISSTRVLVLDNCRMVARSDIFEHPEWPDPWPELSMVTPLPNAMAYRICLVASGQADAAIALAPKADWDLAAAALILQEAGGQCTDHTGQDFKFNCRRTVQRSVVAAGIELHKLIIDRTKPIQLPSAEEIEQNSVAEARTNKLKTKSSVTDNNLAGQLNSAERKVNMTGAETTDQKQLLHIVLGGELKNVSGVEFEDLSAMHFVGAFASYDMAYDAWKAAAQRTVDNAEMRYFILHAHRLLDPDTGNTHDV